LPARPSNSGIFELSHCGQSAHRGLAGVNHHHALLGLDDADVGILLLCGVDVARFLDLSEVRAQILGLNRQRKQPSVAGVSNARGPSHNTLGGDG
jgi:hypothetical protein